MKIFKSQKIAVLLCALCVTFSPISALAIEKRTTTEAPKTETTQQTSAKQTQTKCQELDQIFTNLQNQLSQRKASVDSKRVDISKKSVALQKSRESELTKKRAEWDSQRQKNFDTLRTKAETDEQKQAVEEYVATVTDAIKNRRAANDVVFATFRSELESLKKTIGQSVESNISSNSESISKAIASARAACESGQSIDTAKQNLEAVLLVSRMQAKDNRVTSSKSDQLKVIKQKRDDALKSNTDAFLETTKQARSHLKTAFSQ